MTIRLLARMLLKLRTMQVVFYETSKGFYLGQMEYDGNWWCRRQITLVEVFCNTNVLRMINNEIKDIERRLSQVLKYNVNKQLIC